MTVEKARTIPPPPPRRDVSGFWVTPEQDIDDPVTAPPPAVARTDAASSLVQAPAPVEDDTPVIPVSPEQTPPTPASEPQSTDPTAVADSVVPASPVRRSMQALLTPAVAAQLAAYCDAHEMSRGDVLIAAWVHHGATLVEEYGPGPEAESRDLLGVRRHPLPKKRPSGRVNVNFVVTETERTRVEESAAEAGFRSRSDFVEALILRELVPPIV